MKQVLQHLGTGQTTVVDVPSPSATPGSLLIRTSASLISAGTERMLVDFGRGSMIAKVRQQPDKVAQVFDKMRTDGVAATLEAVRSKLDQPIALGYCNVGRVLEVGRGAEGFEVGDRVDVLDSRVQLGLRVAAGSDHRLAQRKQVPAETNVLVVGLHEQGHELVASDRDVTDRRTIDDGYPRLEPRLGEEPIVDLLPGAREVGRFELTGEHLRRIRVPEAPIVIVRNCIGVSRDRFADLELTHRSILTRSPHRDIRPAATAGCAGDPVPGSVLEPTFSRWGRPAGPH